ncbi:hypothetical protein BKA63DRAFT_12096 [Paraphoma chrysanthemicola]|nr:hypothetical protein BKA63DRAFT_12096 [Paraphoma chrysanthemicola]
MQVPRTFAPRKKGRVRQPWLYYCFGQVSLLVWIIGAQHGYEGREDSSYCGLSLYTSYWLFGDSEEQQLRLGKKFVNCSHTTCWTSITSSHDSHEVPDFTSDCAVRVQPHIGLPLFTSGNAVSRQQILVQGRTIAEICRLRLAKCHGCHTTCPA